MTGQAVEALDVGRQLVAALSSMEAAPQRQVEAHLLVARAAAAATRWGEAEQYVEAAAHFGATGVQMQSRIDALRAHIAMGRGAGDEAAAHAAQAGAAPEAICEALEVLGREARLRDLAQAAKHFEDAESVARQADLVLWRLRALHELGTVDMLERLCVDRLEEARPLADHIGAVVVGAVIDLQLAGTFTLRFEPEPALAASRRCVEVARRGGIELVVAMAWAHAAAAHAVAARPIEMEQAIAEAMSSGEHPDVVATVWGHARAMQALLGEDRSAAAAALDAAVRWASRPACTIVPLSWGLRAVVRTLEDCDSEGARTDARTARFLSTGFNRALLGYADAISMGRAGDHAEAAAAVERSDAILAGYERSHGYRHLCRRLVAEAAIADGWGDPAGWLREALGFAEVRGFPALASACRGLLRRSGAAVPRRRGGTEVPGKLRALGITGREMDVLALLGTRLANQEIADQLFMSVRTVEKHVERLKDKTGVRSRSGLAAFARDGA